MDINFTFVCRFCLRESQHQLKPISTVPCTVIFTKVTGLQFSDDFSNRICDTCEEVFENFNKFIKRCLCNHNALLDSIKLRQNFDKSVQDNARNEDIIKLEKALDETTNNFIQNEPQTTQVQAKNSFNLQNEDIIKLEMALDKTSNNVLPERCKICDAQFTGKLELNRHLRKCATPPAQIKCDRCNEKFKNKTLLCKHYKQNPSCKSHELSCAVCHKLFTMKHKLQTHMRSHTKETPFECTECGKMFRFQQNLRRHMLIIHKGVKPFKCEICGKEFSRAHVKKEHMNIHTGDNPYMCTYCGKGFKRYSSHFIHVYRHKLANGEVEPSDGKKPYLQLHCKICNKIFASGRGLANHSSLHQDEPRMKSFLCYECGKGFVTKSQLESHMRTHTGDKPYQCNICEKKFGQKSALNNHHLMHSGKKPHQCGLCQKLFTQAAHLKVHLRVHSGEKPFVCSFCGKSFALKSNLKVHTRTHTGETPYICAMCGQGYYDSTNLKKHMAKSH